MKRNYGNNYAVLADIDWSDKLEAQVTIRGVNSALIGKQYGQDPIEQHVIERLASLTPIEEFGTEGTYRRVNSNQIYCNSLDRHIDEIQSLRSDGEKIEHWLSMEYDFVHPWLQDRKWIYIPKIPIKDINYPTRLQRLDKNTLNKYKNKSYKPVLLCDGNTKLLDGFHRLCAALSLKKKTVSIIKLLPE